MSKTKPSKKPTTKVGHECVRAMEQLRDALALTKPIHDRAIAAAVKKERERCIRIAAKYAHPNIPIAADICDEIRNDEPIIGEKNAARIRSGT